MITGFFYGVIGVLLIVIQTSLFSDLLARYHLFNLMTPFIIYIGLFRSLPESIAAALLLGALMDAVTGGPFGVYMMTYFWIVVGERWGRQFLHAGSILLLPMMCAFGVMIENSALIGVSLASGNGDVLLPAAYRALVIQMVWAVFLGPPIIAVIQLLHTVLDRRSGEASQAGQEKW